MVFGAQDRCEHCRFSESVALHEVGGHPIHAFLEHGLGHRRTTICYELEAREVIPLQVWYLEDPAQDDRNQVYVIDLLLADQVEYVDQVDLLVQYRRASHVERKQRLPYREVERWQNLKTRFETLDNNYLSGLSTKGKDEVFVAHSAFGYLADRYGFEQHGVIGISADEQPSASVYATLVDMMIEHETYVVYVDPVYADESAQTLKNELHRLSGKDVTILELYFMLGAIDGLDYFEQQTRNLENLKIGLEA